MKNQFITCCRKALVAGAAVGLCTALFMGGAVAADKDSGGRKLAKSTKKYTDAPFSVDSLVGTLKFQFEPALETDRKKYAPIDFYKNTDSPIWMLANMGAPLLFDTTTFKLADMTASADGWSIKSALPDEIYGSIAVDIDVKKSGEAHLKLSTASGVAQNYSGNLFPYERLYVFANEKAAKRAAKNQTIIDSIVPKLTFKIYGSSISRMDYIGGANESVLITPQYLSFWRYSITVLERVNDKWYVRLEQIRDASDKNTIEDFCINVFTGEAYTRANTFDILPLNWRAWKESAGYIAPA